MTTNRWRECLNCGREIWGAMYCEDEAACEARYLAAQQEGYGDG